MSKFILAFVSLCLFFVGAQLLNVFFTDPDLYQGVRTGKIVYLLDSLKVAIPLCCLLIFLAFRNGIDGISILFVCLIVWILCVGRSGGSLWESEKWWYFFAGMVMFWVVRNTFDQMRTVSNQFWEGSLLGLIITIAAIGGVQAILGELQLLGRFTIFHSLYQVTGTFFNPAPYAGFMVASLPFGLALICAQRTSRWHFAWHWVGWCSCLLILAVLPATQSRASWVALVAAVGYFCYCHYQIGSELTKLYFRFRRIFTTVAILALLVLSAGAVGLYAFKKDSADGRLLIWKVSASIASQHPWTGTGFDTFQAHYAPALAEYFASGSGSVSEKMLAGNVQWAFNEPLQFAVELGLPAALMLIFLFFAALFVPIREEWKTGAPRLVLLAARSSILAIFTFGLFSYPFYSAPITILFCAALALVAAASRKVTLGGVAPLVHGCVLLLFVWGGYHMYVYAPQIRQAYWLWHEAESLYRIKAYQVASISFEEAAPILQGNGLFMQQYGKCLQMKGDYLKAKQVLEQSGKYYKDDFWYITMGAVCSELRDFSAAEQYYLLAADMVPHKLYPKYLLAKLYDATEQQDKATRMARHILQADVKVRSTAVQEMRREMKDLLDKADDP